MIPYTEEENQWVSTGKYRKSNTNPERRVEIKEKKLDLRKRTWGIQTTIEVDGKDYIVPIQF